MASTRAAILAATTAGVLVAGMTSAEASTEHAYGGHAFGSRVSLGTLAQSGRSAYVPLCTTKPGQHRRDHTGKTRIPQVGTIGAVTTMVASKKIHGGIASVSRAKTAATSLFASVIKAKAITANAEVAHTDKGFTLGGATTLLGLRVMGKSMPVHPRKNQTMSLPGLGSITLNRQAVTRRAGEVMKTVTALKITLGTHNSMGLPAGEIVIGRTSASLHKETHRQPSGSAFGTSVNAGGKVVSGNTAPVYLPCGGTGGATVSNNTAKVHAPKALTTGATTTRGRSTDNAKRTVAFLTAKTASVHLLGNTITASAVRAAAKATRTNGALHRSSEGTKVVGLRINGKAVNVKQKPNTKRSIPGVGTLWIRHVVRTHTGLHVYALQLQLAVAQSGLKKGTIVRISGATAAVAKH